MKGHSRHLQQAVFFLSVAAVFPLFLAGCALGGASGGSLMIRGELTSRERIVLPSEGVAVVELARSQDGLIVAEQRLPLSGRQLPVPFEVRVLRSGVEERATYFVRGVVAVYGRIRWITDAVEIQARPGITEVGALALKLYEPAAFSAPLVCGNRIATVGVGRIGQREVLQLAVGTERFELYETVTASGSRYEAVNDASTSVWFKGERAILTVRGESYPECVVGD